MLYIKYIILDCSSAVFCTPLLPVRIYMIFVIFLFLFILLRIGDLMSSILIMNFRSLLGDRARGVKVEL